MEKSSWTSNWFSVLVVLKTVFRLACLFENLSLVGRVKLKALLRFIGRRSQPQGSGRGVAGVVDGSRLKPRGARCLVSRPLDRSSTVKMARYPFLFRPLKCLPAGPGLDDALRWALVLHGATALAEEVARRRPHGLPPAKTAGSVSAAVPRANCKSQFSDN